MCEGSIEISVKQIGCDWIELIQFTAQWPALVNTAMSLWVSFSVLSPSPSYTSFTFPNNVPRL
jgi:hypothetical protein